ncbi:MAG: hypothetical protein ABIH70_00990 [Chloroflexota bacterium]
MADMVVELPGELFKRQYLLYIIELSRSGSRYFYIGQTGDTRVITARPVFRRLAAHLEDRKSTQNQVYQYVAHRILEFPEYEGKKIAFTQEARQAVEKYLVKGNLKMHAYSLEPFVSSISREEHVKRRRKTQKIEEQVIALFRKNRRELMNQKVVASVSLKDCPYRKVMKQIAKDFDLTIK